MSVKAVWKDDVRRFKVDMSAADAFEQLLAGVLRLYKQPADARFTIRYLDDENELITVTSTEELLEAQRVAQQSGRSLKFILEKVETGDEKQPAAPASASASASGAGAAAPPTPTPAASASGVVLSRASVEALASVVAVKSAAEDDLPAAAAPADAAPAAAPTPAEPSFGADQAIELFLAILQQEWAMAEIETACAVAQRGIAASLPAEEVVANVFGECKRLAASELAEKLKPLWPAIFAAARQLDLSTFKISKIVSFIPQLLRACERPCLVQILGNVFRGNLTNFEGIEQNAVIIDVQPGGDFAPPSAPEPKPAEPERAVHHNIICDMCEMSPIVGVRYKCQRCPDFDMCEACEAKGLHPADHVLLKIFEPVRGFGAWRSFSGRGGRCGHNNVGNAGGRGCRQQQHPARAEFVSDGTVPDHTQVAPGAVLSKVWMVKNASHHASWPAGVRLAYLSGDVVPTQGITHLAPVAAAAAGEVVPVSVDVRCPEKPGRFVGNYRLQLPSGVFFGHRLWVSVDVAEPAPAPVAAAPAAPAEPVLELAPCSAVQADASAAPAVVVVAAASEPEAVPAAAAAATDAADAADAKAIAASEQEALKQQYAAYPHPAEMVMLHNLGFRNADLNMYLLQNQRGNVQAVVDWLLNNM